MIGQTDRQTNRNLQLYIHRKLAEVAGLSGEFFFAFFYPWFSQNMSAHSVQPFGGGIHGTIFTNVVVLLNRYVMSQYNYVLYLTSIV